MNIKSINLILIIPLLFIVSCNNNRKEIIVIESEKTYELSFDSPSSESVYSVDVELNYDISHNVDLNLNNSLFNLKGKGHKLINSIDYYSNHMLIKLINNNSNGKVSISVTFKSL